MSLIKEFEGLRLTAYLDGGGVWTVGYGATGDDITKGTVWTQERADADLESRLFNFDAQLSVLVPHDLPDNRRVALLSLVYNIGIGAFKTSTLLKKLNAGDIQGAADQFLRWKYDNRVEVPGLLKRREREREIFLNG